MVSDKTCNFAPAFENKRAFSSVGLEHLPYKQRVGGSNPSTPTHHQNDFIFGRLAQLVQSICLTSRGSAVRIRQRPPIAFPIKNHGWFPEWPNGADCKSAASSFGGSNPSPPTSTRDCFAAVSFFILFFYPLLLFSSFILFFYPLSFILFILHPIYWVSSGVLAKRCSCCLPCSKILTRVARCYLL